MDSHDPVRTAPEAVDRIDRLTEGVWALAAVASLGGSDELGEALGAVLVESGFAARDNSGGIVVAPGVDDLRARTGEAFSATIASTVARALDAARGNAIGWDPDDDTLLAQGRASAAVGRLLASIVASELPGLADRLAQEGAAVLDVGTGIAELACAIAESLPATRVVGIDIHNRALALAARTIADRRLEARVVARKQDVAEIADTAVYDLVWLPLPFISLHVVLEALPRLCDSLRDGGWLVAGLGRLHEKPLALAVAKWQAELAGGTALAPNEALHLLVEHSFTDVVVVDVPPGSPVLVAGRRRSTTV